MGLIERIAKAQGSKEPAPREEKPREEPEEQPVPEWVRRASERRLPVKQYN